MKSCFQKMIKFFLSKRKTMHHTESLCVLVLRKRYSVFTRAIRGVNEVIVDL